MSTATTIQQYYNAFYGRAADPSGLAFWVSGVDNSGDLVGAALKVFGSATTPEFALRYPAGTTISTFIDTAYGNMFNRAADADGKEFWSAAFTNWVASGRSEGEARALILKNFVDAANGQTGTSDKLTITNKLTVADLMTASVKAYGTEAVYLTGLTKAQGLLASVDHTPASVTSAAERVKNGLVDGVDPVTGAPNKQAHIVMLEPYLAGDLVNIHKIDASPAILKISSAADSPFGWVYKKFDLSGVATVGEVLGENTVGGNANFAALSIIDFSTTNDRLDLTSLNLGSIKYKSLGTALDPFYFVGSYNGSTGYVTHSQNFKTIEGFFGDANVAAVDVSTQSWRTWIFIDVNKNGNLDLGSDMFLQLAGVHPSQLSAATFLA
jgi:hypothetical protein